MPLSVVKLSKRFDTNWVLRDAALEAADGEVLGLFGGTASGKTTLLNILCGVEKANGGTILLDAADITRIAAKERDIHLHLDESGPGWTALFKRKGGERSRGLDQAADLEETLAQTGRVVLLDDPFTRMDRRLRSECFEIVRRAARARDRVVVLATSDFDQVAEVCDRVAVLAGGEIAQSGVPQEVYENPASMVVAQVTGENNLFPARRLTSTDAALPEFFTIDGGHRLFAQATEKRSLGAINQNVNLAIRPEQISISFGASFPEDNLLRAVVTGIRFRGSTTLIEFDAAGLTLEARVFKIVGLGIGDECMLGLPPHRLQILKD